MIRIIVAAPLVALLGAAMTVAAWPNGDATGPDRDLVARLSRGGVQRLDADGAHWTADVVDHALTVPSADAPVVAREALVRTPATTLATPSAFTRIAPPAARRLAGRLAAPSRRGRAPPRA